MQPLTISIEKGRDNPCHHVLLKIVLLVWQCVCLTEIDRVQWVEGVIGFSRFLTIRRPWKDRAFEMGLCWPGGQRQHYLRDLPRSAAGKASGRIRKRMGTSLTQMTSLTRNRRSLGNRDLSIYVFLFSLIFSLLLFFSLGTNGKATLLRPSAPTTLYLIQETGWFARKTCMSEVWSPDKRGQHGRFDSKTCASQVWSPDQRVLPRIAFMPEHHLLSRSDRRRRRVKGGLGALNFQWHFFTVVKRLDIGVGRLARRSQKAR